MILNELYKLNELNPDTLANYKKAAGADATAADAAGDYARGNKRFKGIVRATKKQFANDTKGVAEAADPESQKFGKYIKKYFGQIYDYGDDGLEYLDNNAPFWAMLFDKHNGDIDYIIAMEPADVLKKAALELKAMAGDLKYELDEQGVAEGLDKQALQKELIIINKLIKVMKNSWQQQHLLQKKQELLKQLKQGVAEGSGPENKMTVGQALEIAKKNNSSFTEKDYYDLIIRNEGLGSSFFNSEVMSAIQKKQGVAEGSGPKEKQKTPYRDINSPEYRAAADKQKQKMAQDKAAEPGKKMLAKQGVAETNVAKYKDLGANDQTTHFIKNVTTGKIVSPHRSLQDAKDSLVASLRDSNDEFKIVRARKSGVAEDSLNEFAPGAGGDDEAGDDPYKYPKPKRYNRSADYFEQFEADHFDREDFDDDTGVFKGYWGNTQIAYFKFDNPARTGGDDSGMGWYYEPESAGRSDDTNAAPAADRSEERKQQELGMISQFLKSGNRPNPDSQIGRLMKKYGMTEGQVNELSSDLLKQAAQVAKNKSDRAMDPKIHDALGGGYMNPLAKHYDNMSDKFSNRAAKVGQKDAVKKIASPAAMRKIGMAEGSNNSRTIIAEALITERLWSTAGRKLMEAQLTADQITQIFQQIQQGATAAGDNRTLIGKGKDAAGAVSAAWTDLKDKIYNSKPMSNFASAYDQAAEKLKQATGGDAGAMKYVQKYRDFATKNPMLQSAIYAALIAASGISGVGIAGAAALGLFKLVDQALQGKDIRSAMWSGVKTGAQAFAAGQIGQALKGQPAGDVLPTGATDAASTAADAANNINVSALQDLASDPNLSPIARDLAAKLAAGKDVNGMSDYLNAALRSAAQKASMMGDMPDGSANAGMRQFMSLQNFMKAVDGHPAMLKESVTLSESQIFFVIGKIVERQRKLDEGIMDTIKGAAGKAVGSVVNYAKTKGTNLTTKITADKLLQAWKKAGSPMDSLTVAKVIQDAGVPATSIQQVYSTMKIPFAGEPGGGSMPAPKTAAPAPASGPGDPTPLLSPAQLAAKRDPAAPAPAPKTVAPQGFNAANVMKMPGMEKPAKPAPAKAPSFSGPTGYSSVNTTVKQPIKQPAVAEGAAKFDPKTGLPASGQILEFGGDATQFSTPTQSTPTTEQPPRRGYSIILTGKPGRDWMAEYAWQALEKVLPRDYPGNSSVSNYSGDTTVTPAMQKVLEVANQGSAVVKTGITSEDIAETLVAKLVANRVPAQYWRVTSEDLDEDQGVDEGLGSKFAGLGLAGAMAFGAAGANARVMPGDDPNINRLTGKPIATQMAPAQMPNQNLQTVDKIDVTADGITITQDGKSYDVRTVPKDSPTPRNGKKMKVSQSQVGERGIGNYVVYLINNGTAYLYKGSVNEGVTESAVDELESILKSAGVGRNR